MRRGFETAYRTVSSECQKIELSGLVSGDGDGIHSIQILYAPEIMPHFREGTASCFFYNMYCDTPLAVLMYQQADRYTPQKMCPQLSGKR